MQHKLYQLSNPHAREISNGGERKKKRTQDKNKSLKENEEPINHL